MSLEGKWVNELGSTMELTVGQNGVVTGTYLSSKAGEDKDTEPLQGLSQAGSVGVYVGWTVCFHNTSEPADDPSVCAWSGHYFDRDGAELIETTWLLTHVTDELQHWDSTNVGRNTFTRKPPE